MENKKTHWRNVYKSDFLASWDIDNEELLTIDFAEEKMCKLSRGEEKKVVINFKEKTLSNGVVLKPMICNPSNSKIISKFVGSGIIEEWSGLSVLISIKENKGKVGNSEGLYIKSVFNHDYTNEINNATTVNELKVIYEKVKDNSVLVNLIANRKKELENVG